MELARALSATVLVVAADRLGVINHAQLTLSALELAGLEVTGVSGAGPLVVDILDWISAAR